MFVTSHPCFELVTPKTMMDFFRKSEGIWWTQRTVHHFDAVADESGQSKLYIQVVETEDPKLLEFCQSQGIDPKTVGGGATFMWHPHELNQAANPAQAALIIDIPDDATPWSGQLIRSQGYVEKVPVVTRYWFGQDGILTMDTDYDNHQGQERCWFMNHDFRVRVTNVRMVNGVYLVAYCSERRCFRDEEIPLLAKSHLLHG